MYKLMCAGPTQVHDEVMKKRALPFTNPDLDPAFVDFYKETCDILSRLAHTKNQCLILNGEGIMGLEAACMCLTEKDDNVLVLDNGVFGRGFADFVTMYGGNPTIFESDYREPFSLAEIRNHLEENKSKNYKYATMVHCDTPSGLINPVEEISILLKEYGILSVVDTVAGIFGEPIDMDKGRIDILCGGSQKALSAPPGLTMVWVSDDAWYAMESRKTPIGGFYLNLMMYRDYFEKKAFPYTMPASDIMGLRQAVEMVEQDEEILKRHAKMGEAVRTALKKCGIALYLKSGFSNTATAIDLPTNIKPKDVLEKMMHDYDIIISGSLGPLEDRVIRIGHMGENARKDDLALTLDALQSTLSELGMNISGNLKMEFLENLK